MTEQTQTADTRVRKEPRFSTHITWNPNHHRELLFCQAFRLLPHGFSKRVIARMIDAVVGEAKDPQQIAAVLFKFLQAPDDMARSVIVGGAPPSWQEMAPISQAQASVSTTRPMQHSELVQQMYRHPPPGYRYSLVPEPQPGYHYVPHPQQAPQPQQQPMPEQAHAHAAAPRQLPIGGIMGD